MKIVIDTNILVSRFLKSEVCRRVLEYVRESKDMKWVLTQDIEKEYREVLLRPKFGFPIEEIEEWFELFDEIKILIPVQEKIDFPRDRKDAKFIECSLASDAAYLISGDRDFDSAQDLLPRTKVISPVDFLKLI